MSTTPPGRAEFRATVDATGDPVVVSASGELDLSSADELLAATTDHLGPGRRVRLDLAAVTFMDSSGIRVLDTLMRAPGAADGGFTVAPDFHPHVRSVLVMTGLLALLPLAG